MKTVVLPARYNFLYFIKPRLRSAPPGALPALAAPALLPPARSALPPPTRAHMWIGPKGHEPSTDLRGHGQDDASGGGSAGTGMKGAPFPAAGP
ncbi:hypothetical protein [Streptomyces flaveus]|uniref:hypothetical protein n=1 Tax=Streptomyces flaveus TaxID=66370 RepID=UPI00331AF4B1